MQEKEFEYLKPLHKELKKTLKLFSSIAKKAHVDYFLAYGTLLGAARHKDIIPWDDDIDIAMKRSDYEKLIAYFSNNPIKDAELSCYDIDGSLSLYAKFIKKNTDRSISKYYTHPKGICIDIFPLDGALASTNIFQKINEIRIRTLKRAVSSKIKLKHKNMSDSFLKKLIRVLFVLPFLLVNNSKLIHKAIILSKRYDGANGQDLVFYGTTYPMKREHNDKHFWDKTVSLELGDDVYPAPAGYKKILTTCYGSDYNKIPSRNVLHIHDNVNQIGWAK